MNENEIMKEIMKGIDEELLKKEDVNELAKFRSNLSKVIKGIIKGDLESKRVMITAIKEGMLEIISQIPVVTPIITAMFQVITGEDLSSKMDNLNNKMDTMLSLQREILSLQKRTIEILEERLPPK